MEQNGFYDLIVVGGGPAGYTAGIYGARAAMKTLVIDQSGAGGQMINTPEIDNYPGLLGVDGFTLGQKLQQQAEQCGAESCRGTVAKLELTSAEKHLTLVDGRTFTAKTVILAMGASPRKLQVPGEREFVGKGVSYCATCDGMFFRKKTVVVVGGGNTAVEDALFLSRICEKVYLVHRRNEFRADAVSVAKLRSMSNVEFVLGDTVKEIQGSARVNAVVLNSGKTLDCSGIFIAVGAVPNTDLVQGILSRSEEGYIVANETTETEIPGVFAAGDLRTKPLRQIVTAAADGAVAVHMAEKYLLTKK